MAKFGHLQEFDTDLEPITAYLERVELYFSANGIGEDKKLLARSYLWWPGLDKCLEEKAKSCLSCQEVKNNPPVAPLHPWIWPTQPWKRVHIDFTGPFKSHMFLVVIDAHSKWPEVKMMQSTTSQRTI